MIKFHNCINLFHPHPSHTCVNICTWLFLPHIHINVCTWLSPYTQWMLKHMCANIYIHTLSACIIASSWQIIIGQEENWYYPKYLFYHCYERHVWVMSVNWENCDYNLQSSSTLKWNLIFLQTCLYYKYIHKKHGVSFWNKGLCSMNVSLSLCQ